MIISALGENRAEEGMLEYWGKWEGGLHFEMQPGKHKPEERGRGHADILERTCWAKETLMQWPEARAHLPGDQSRVITGALERPCRPLRGG